MLFHGFPVGWQLMLDGRTATSPSLLYILIEPAGWLLFKISKLEGSLALQVCCVARPSEFRRVFWQDISELVPGAATSKLKFDISELV